jgi:hypothetical protein
VKVVECRVLIESLHGRHEGAVVGVGQIGHDRDRERVDQPGDEGHRHQRGAEHEPGPAVAVDTVTGRPNRLGHGRADVEVGHPSVAAGVVVHGQDYERAYRVLRRRGP